MQLLLWFWFDLVQNELTGQLRSAQARKIILYIVLGRHVPGSLSCDYISCGLDCAC